MSYLYSRALVAEFLADTCSDGGRSAPWSSTDTPLAFCAPGKMKDFSRLSRFGTTFAPFPASLGVVLLTWYRAGFRARTSASPARETGSTAGGPDCGQSWRASWGRVAPSTQSLRLAQSSLLEDSTESLRTLPRSGSLRNGTLYLRPTVVPRTYGSESGSLPTPTAIDATSGRFNRSPTPGASMRPTLAKMSMLGLWPTPTTKTNVQIQGIGAAAANPKRGTTLAGAVTMWPTPGASDHKSGTGYDHTQNSHPPQLRHLSGGLLNPTWVEWLIGWPLGWTDLNPSGTDKFQSWRRLHSACFPQSSGDGEK